MIAVRLQKIATKFAAEPFPCRVCRVVEANLFFAASGIWFASANLTFSNAISMTKFDRQSGLMH